MYRMATVCVLEHSGNSPQPVENLHGEAAGLVQQMWVSQCLFSASATEIPTAKYLKTNVHFGMENASSFFLQCESNIFSLGFRSICIFMCL